jgi:hypothetical protein
MPLLCTCYAMIALERCRECCGSFVAQLPAWSCPALVPFPHRHRGAPRRRRSARRPKWFDLGPLDVHALLAQGHLRAADLQARMQRGTPMGQPTRFLLPVPQPGKILCLAKNYVAHAREFGAEAPPEPIFFAKLPDTLVPHGAPTW